MKEIFIDAENFKRGLYALEDTTKAPFGSARVMRNTQITDRGGIAPRPGTELLGTRNNSTHAIKGFYNYRKSFDQEEILVKAYDTFLEAYSKKYLLDWQKVKTTFTADSEFGFINSLVNASNEDYLILSNRYDPYQRWTGAMAKTTSALAGGELSIPVDSVLTDEIFASGTSTGNSATTLTVASATWATGQYVNLYVYIPSTGKVRKITANTGTVLTFDTLGGAPGNVAFQIRKLKFPATGSVIYNGTVIAYTGIDVATGLTVASAHAAPSDSLVFEVPTEYPGAPRGNRLANYLGRIMVGRVRSALARDSGGALQGFSSGGSVFVSKINDPFSFDFSATRVAGEGDIISMPYGGDEITDVIAQEDSAYAFKPEYIEAIKYSQDTNDVVVRTPLKQGVGSVGRVIKGSDDSYFITRDKKFTSIGRVATKDVLPQTDNIGFSIKRLLDVYDFENLNGIEDNDRVFLNGKSASTVENNDITLVYSKINKSFEGVWDIAASGFARFNKKLYYAESAGANVLEMYVGHSDVFGTTRYPIACEYASHFMNLTPSKSNLQALNSLYFEGYIRPGSHIDFKVWKGFSTTPFLQFTFQGTESATLDGSIQQGSMGMIPLGGSPMGGLGAIEDDGRRHFFFTVYFPFQYDNYFSVGWGSLGTDIDWEISRYGLGLSEDVSSQASRVKNI